MKRAQSSVLATAEATDFPLNAAPDEIISEILFHLPPAQWPRAVPRLFVMIVELEQVSQKWKKLIQEHVFWRRKFVESFCEPKKLTKPFHTYLLEHCKWTWKRIFWKTSEAQRSVDDALDELSAALLPSCCQSSELRYRELLRCERLMHRYGLCLVRESNPSIADERYIEFATLYTVYELQNFWRDEEGVLHGEGIGVGDPPASQFLEDVDTLLRNMMMTSTVLLSSDAFSQVRPLRFKLLKALQELAARQVELNFYSDPMSVPLQQAHMTQYLDESNPKEAQLKESLQHKAIDGITRIRDNSGRFGRIKYYNLGCVHALLGNNEECCKNLRFAFNYKDYQYVYWAFLPYPSTRNLLEGLTSDEDFASVRNTTEFKEVIKFAKSMLIKERKFKRSNRLPIESGSEQEHDDYVSDNEPYDSEYADEADAFRQELMK